MRSPSPQLSALDEACGKIQLQVPAYCLMRNHFRGAEDELRVGRKARRAKVRLAGRLLLETTIIVKTARRPGPYLVSGHSARLEAHEGGFVGALLAL